jgi:site-specific recombinase XerD
MTDECISPLRRRMIEDMTVRNFVAKTQSDYIRRVKNFAIFLGRSPARASREDVRRYLLHLASSRAGAGTVNGTGSALRFFFDVTLDRADIVRHLPIARAACWRRHPASSTRRRSASPTGRVCGCPKSLRSR